VDTLIPYYRQSRAKERTISIDEQRRDVQRWAKASGVRLGAEVVEQNVSGSKPWRERALGGAIESVERGDAAGVVVAWQDRLSRENGLGTAEVWEALDRIGARLVCANEGLDTATGDHELTFSIKAAVARDQWKRYRANWERAKRSAIDSGIHFSAQVPVGYVRDAETRRLVPSPASAKAIKRAFGARAAGASYGEVADLLDRLLPREGGGLWTRQTVDKMLRNTCYRGEARQGDVVNPSAHKPLVDEATWLMAQPRRSPERKVGERSGALLSGGLLRCGSCGRPMSRTTSRTYGCRGRRSDGECPAPVQVTTAVEGLVLDAFCDRGAVRVRETKGGGSVDAGAAARDLERARAELDNYLAADIAGVIGAAKFRSGVEQRQAAVNAAEEKVAASGPPQQTAVLDLDDPKAVRAAVDKAPGVEAKRRMLAGRIDRVVVAPASAHGARRFEERVKIKWR
jgi:DNA invertase Pin-like site-specific DNA recombinase